MSKNLRVKSSEYVDETVESLLNLMEKFTMVLKVIH